MEKKEKRSKTRMRSCFAVGCTNYSAPGCTKFAFFRLPKEPERCREWLHSIGREDLLFCKKISLTFVVCSAHFDDSDFVILKRLKPDAVPKRFLCQNEKSTSESPNPDRLIPKSDEEYSDVICNNCKKPVIGFQYKCVTCEDFDLCQKCEAMETHRQHFMLRIPKLLKFKMANDLIKKWRKFFNAEHVTPDALDSDTELTEDSSDDDQPITNYTKNYDSGVDLSEDVKETIRKEIQRVASLKLDQQKKIKDPTKIQMKEDKKRQANAEEERDKIIVPIKRLKVIERDRNTHVLCDAVPEVVFADVNNIKDQGDLKSERVEYPDVMPVVSSVYCEGSSRADLSVPSTSGIPAVQAPVTIKEMSADLPGTMQQPVMHVKLSDDLSELMIEVSNPTTFYKYT